MAESVWAGGKLTAVYNPVGKTEGGEVRFRRAWFDVLLWAQTAGGRAETYVLPLGIVQASASELGILDADWEFGREFGYYGPGAHITEPNHGGGGSDSLFDLHNFGYF